MAAPLSSSRHSVMRVVTRADSSTTSPSMKQSASIAWPPEIVSGLAPLARTACQARPGPRSSAACVMTLRFALSASPM